ncbi:MAG: hydantoinase/oxoprolinase family protein, partial [Pseudomonadota bacterium]
ARWMTGADHALVSDIGGTTTDVALLRDGKPKIDPAGARVGPWRTMVEAVAMRTTGLGGDSEVHVIDEGLTGGLTLGPRRVLPVSLIATEAPDVVLPALEEQLRSDTPGEHDTRFVRAVPGVDAGGLAAKDAALLERIGGAVSPLAQILRSRLENSALKRLVARGLVQVSGVTPSDASHALDLVDAWDNEAARTAIKLIARKRTGSGDVLSETVEDMAQMIIDQLTHQTSLALLESAFSEEDTDFGLSPTTLAQHVLMQKGLDQHRGLLRFDAGLNLPVVGLGASAPSYYPAVGDRLGTEMILPQYAGVANAVGAVVGRVSFRRVGTVTAPADGRFRVHLDSGPEDFVNAEDAMSQLESHLTQVARTDAQQAGAEDITVTTNRDIRMAKVEAREVFIEAEITVEASGRARIAS